MITLYSRMINRVLAFTFIATLSVSAYGGDRLDEYCSKLNITTPYFPKATRLIPKYPKTAEDLKSGLDNMKKVIKYAVESRRSRYSVGEEIFGDGFNIRFSGKKGRRVEDKDKPAALLVHCKWHLDLKQKQNYLDNFDKVVAWNVNYYIDAPKKKIIDARLKEQKRKDDRVAYENKKRATRERVKREEANRIISSLMGTTEKNPLNEIIDFSNIQWTGIKLICEFYSHSKVQPRYKTVRTNEKWETLLSKYSNYSENTTDKDARSHFINSFESLMPANSLSNELKKINTSILASKNCYKKYLLETVRTYKSRRIKESVITPVYEQAKTDRKTQYVESVANQLIENKNKVNKLNLKITNTKQVISDLNTRMASINTTKDFIEVLARAKLMELETVLAVTDQGEIAITNWNPEGQVTQQLILTFEGSAKYKDRNGFNRTLKVYENTPNAKLEYENRLKQNGYYKLLGEINSSKERLSKLSSEIKKAKMTISTINNNISAL